MSVQKIAELLFGNDKASDRLWNIAYALIGLGSVLFVIAFWKVVMGNLDDWVWYLSYGILGGVLASGGFAMINKCQIKIPANPPHKAILTIWGKRLNVLIDEGDVMRFPFWPLNIDYILVPFGRKNFDFVFPSIICLSGPAVAEGGSGNKVSAGGSVQVKVSLTIGPDGNDSPDEAAAKKVIKFLNNGGMDKVAAILEDQASQSVREIAGKFDWETFTFMKDPLTVMLLTRIADIDLRELEVDPATGLLKPEMFNLKKTAYEAYPKIVDPTSYLFEHFKPNVKPGEKQIEEKRVEQEIKVFLQIAREACFVDIMDLGIEIFRLNVTHIEASDELKKAAEANALEDKQNQSESKEIRTNIELAQMVVDASKRDGGKQLTFEEALEYVLVIKKLIPKKIDDTRISGFEKLIQQFLNKGEG